MRSGDPEQRRIRTRGPGETGRNYSAFLRRFANIFRVPSWLYLGPSLDTYNLLDIFTFRRRSVATILPISKLLVVSLFGSTGQDPRDHA